MKRNQFVKTICAAAIAGVERSTAARAPRILLRSSWQVANIGDVAHTPGVLTLIERYIPDAEVRLWPSHVGHGVDEMLRRRFPKLQIVSGEEALARAFEECDFLLHGSGPWLVAPTDVERWRTATGRPYGVYGISLPHEFINPKVVGLLTASRFVFFRDTVSMALARARGVACPIMEFGPDGAFAADVRNDAAAKSFLASHNLEPGRFACCIPRYRHAPGWRFQSVQRPVVPEREKRNQDMKEHDHAPLREAIERVVGELKMKVLLCPEDESQMALGKEMLYDPLSAGVKSSVVWRESFWLTDEALSTYMLSAGLFGNEMHSPIMCIGNGVPAIVCRWEEQTSKGFMWRDIGLDDWLFSLDVPADLPRIAPAVVAMLRDPAGARKRAAAARRIVTGRQKATMAVLASELRRISG